MHLEEWPRLLAGGGGSASFLNGVGHIQDGDEDVAVSDRKTGGRDLLGHLGRRGRGVQGRHVGLEIPEHRLERAPPDVVLRHLRADGEPYALPPLRRYAEHVADLRQRAQRRRLHLLPLKKKQGQNGHAGMVGG